MSLPIVFFHKGKHRYLKIAIRRAETSGNEVYLLGDNSNRNFCSKWINFEELNSKNIDLFRSLYVHMSKNTKDFELRCILRYFYLYEFMKKQKLEGVIFMDSDCLVYKKYKDNEYSDSDCAFGWDFKYKPEYICPSSCYWTVEVLEKFIEYCLDIYQNHLDVLEMKWNSLGRKPGGISDMTLLYMWFLSQSDVTIRNLDENTSVLYEAVPARDHDKKQLYQYNKFTGLLKIKFVNDKPHFIKNDGSLQEVANLHMHGGKKIYMYLISKKITEGPLFYLLECVRRLKRCAVRYLVKYKVKK